MGRPPRRVCGSAAKRVGDARGSASGSRRRPAWGCGARPPAARARPPLTLQDDLFECLPLQPVPPPQLLRNVALPAGEIGGAEARRHFARCPGALAPPIRVGAGGHGPQHGRPADAGRPAAQSSRPRTGRLQCRLGRSSGSCRKGFWLGPENPPPHPTAYAARRRVVGGAARRWLMTPCRGRKRRE